MNPSLPGGGGQTSDGGVTQGDLDVQIVTALTFIHYEHEVDPPQYEPGFPSTYQAQRHVLDFSIANFGIQSAFAVADDWLLGFMIPIRIVVSEAEFRDADGAKMPGYESIHHRRETLFGIGDMLLKAGWTPLTPGPEGGLGLSIGLGLSVPTGHTEPNPFELGRLGLAHQHMFFGSGIFQPAYDVSLGYSGSAWRVQAWVGGKIPLYGNEYGYQPPIQFEANLGASSGFGLSGIEFGVDLGVFHIERANWAGEPAETSGRTDLLLQAGITGVVAEALQGFFQVKVPVYTWSVDAQLKVPVILVAGLRTRFNLLD